MTFRTQPFAFIRLGSHWINMAMVTDITDRGEELTLYLASDMARRVKGDGASTVDVARRITVDEPEEVEKLRTWLKLNDVE